MGRKRSTPPISLFSFQDIITSVTAILIVIVLCMCLELLEKTESTAESIQTELVADLRQSLADLRRQLDEMSASPPVTEDLATVAAVSPSELRARLQDYQRNTLAADQKLRQEETRQTELRQQLTRAAAALFDRKTDVDELNRLESQISEVQSRLASLEALDRPIYSMPRGSNRTGWLVVVTSGLIECALLGESRPPLQFRETPGRIPGVESAAQAFLKWVDQSKDPNRYFMILVRPDGAGEFSAIEDRLESRAIAFGFDVVDAQQALIDPVHGAGQP